MEPTLLYGHPQGSSMGLVAALEWLGQPYRLSRVDMMKDMTREAYRRLNGRSETPVLITETGQVVTETTAITGWIEQRDRERRVTFEPGSQDANRMHQWIGFLNTGFTGAFSSYWVALETAQGEPDYQSALRRFGRAQVEDRHAKLEAMIGDTRYLMGDKPTLADAVFVGVARWAEFHEATRPGDYPKIDRLKARLHADPAVKFALAIEDGESPSGSGAMKGQTPLPEIEATFA